MARTSPYLPLPLDEVKRIISAPSTPVHLRLYFLAFLANRGDGHSPFRKGALARQLGIDARNVTRELRQLMALDLIGRESTSRCVVLPFSHQMGEARPVYCTWHTSRTKELRPAGTKKATELRPAGTKTVSELRPAGTKTESVPAGQDVAPSSSNTAPTDEPQPAVSDPTPGRPHLQIVAS